MSKNAGIDAATSTRVDSLLIEDGLIRGVRIGAEPDNASAVGHDGARFADETNDYSVSGRSVRDLPGGERLALSDEDARLAAR